MATKITVTLNPVDWRVPQEHMDQAVAMLGKLENVPTQKIVLTVTCEDEDADSYTDDIEAVLRTRPAGIDAVMQRVSKYHVEHRKLPAVTPMDTLLGDGIEAVTLTHGDKSATLTAETARNAARMLRDI